MSPKITVLAALAGLAIAAGTAACGDDDSSDAAAVTTKPAASEARDFPVQPGFPVVPGKAYTTTLFEPKATITVPDGAWRTDTPESREHLALGLQTDSANLAGVGLHRMTKVADPKAGAATISDAVDGPDDYIQWLADHPRLKATAPKDVEVAGLKGTQIDVQPKSFPKKQPTGCKEAPPFQPCLVLFFDGAEPAWYYRAGKVRFTGVDVGGQQVVIEQLVDPADQFDAITKKSLDPVVEELKFSD